MWIQDPPPSLNNTPRTDSWTVLLTRQVLRLRVFRLKGLFYFILFFWDRVEGQPASRRFSCSLDPSAARGAAVAVTRTICPVLPGRHTTSPRCLSSRPAPVQHHNTNRKCRPSTKPRRRQDATRPQYESRCATRRAHGPGRRSIAGPRYPTPRRPLLLAHAIPEPPRVGSR